MSAISAIKNYASDMFLTWTKEERQLLLSLVDEDKSAHMVDLGCGDCDMTKLFADKINAHEITGVDGLRVSSKHTIENFNFVQGELNHPLPLPDNTFDVVVSHFSLEHLYNTGVFIQETFRILKPGGYTVVATDNLSTWPNVIALALGWQPFSSTHGLALRAIGNPFALRSGEHGGVDVDKELTYESEEWRRSGEWSHNKVLAYRALPEAYAEFGFDIETITGAGYFPLKGALSRKFARLDPRHAHFLALRARKPADVTPY